MLSPHLPARDVLAMVASNAISRDAAIAYLGARVAEKTAAGRKPRRATLKALQQLGGSTEAAALPRDVTPAANSAAPRRRADSTPPAWRVPAAIIAAALVVATPVNDVDAVPTTAPAIGTPYEEFLAKHDGPELRAFFEARDARTCRELESAQDARYRAKLRHAYTVNGVDHWPALAYGGDGTTMWRRQCDARLHAFVTKVRKLHPRPNTPKGFAHLAHPQGPLPQLPLQA